jgi:hypothetical protein
MVLNKKYIIEGNTILSGTDCILQEKVHNFDYVYIDLNKVLSKEDIEEIYRFQLGLNKNNLYIDSSDTDSNGKGIEFNSHITVCFGIVSTSDIERKLVQQLLRKNEFNINLVFDTISFFRRDDKPYDVMKIGINSSGLSMLHKEISNVVFIDGSSMAEVEEYHAHMTLAYIKKGTFSEYENFKFSFSDGIFPIHEIEYQNIYDTTYTLTI